MGTLNWCISQAAFTYYIFASSSYTWMKTRMRTQTFVHLTETEQRRGSYKPIKSQEKSVTLRNSQEDHYKQTEKVCSEFCPKDTCSLCIICVCIIYIHLRSYARTENLFRFPSSSVTAQSLWVKVYIEY